MRQNVSLDGGYGDGPQNNTSRHFQKRAGGKKNPKKQQKNTKLKPLDLNMPRTSTTQMNISVPLQSEMGLCITDTIV